MLSSCRSHYVTESVRQFRKVPEVGMQVLTVHSPVLLENRTGHPLSFILHLASPIDGLKHASDSAESRIPCHSPLAPGSQCYLPLTAMQ